VHTENLWLRELRKSVDVLLEFFGLFNVRSEIKA
jgi:hypothetical protein